MVSMMEVEPKGQICDTRPQLGQRSVDISTKSVDQDLANRTLKLDLVTQHSRDDSDKMGFKSPLSPQTGKPGARIVTHQSSITSQIDVVEDRKALRDALYQGIFSRHRRTIFAFGSFLRMLRSRNSQYNTIRSSSEGDDEGR